MKKSTEGSLSPSPPKALTTTDLADKKKVLKKANSGIGFPLGKVVKDPETGKPKPTVAKRALSRLGETADKNAEFLAVMSADPSPTARVAKFVATASLDANAKKSLPVIAAEVGVPVAEVFLSYARGVKCLGHAQVVERVAEVLAEKAEAAISSLVDQAIPQKIKCENCPEDKRQTCQVCEGEGVIEILPQFWPFAQKRIYELMGIVDKGQGINVTQNVTNKTAVAIQGAPGEFMAKVAGMSDAIMMQPIEAEVVLPEDSPSAAGEAGSSVLEAARDKVQV